MEIMSGTRVKLTGTELEGWTEFPEPGEEAPDAGMVLVMWDERRVPVWERVEDLTID